MPTFDGYAYDENTVFDFGGNDPVTATGGSSSRGKSIFDRLGDNDMVSRLADAINLGLDVATGRNNATAPRVTVAPRAIAQGTGTGTGKGMTVALWVGGGLILTLLLVLIVKR
jgi:hypothetical protein